MAAAGSLEAHQYTCNEGDHIDMIATSLGCTVEQMQECNPGVDLCHLHCHQIINIPCNAHIPPPGHAGNPPECCDHDQHYEQPHCDPEPHCDPAPHCDDHNYGGDHQQSYGSGGHY